MCKKNSFCVKIKIDIIKFRMMNSETLSRALIQSDCLYLQAAGSTGDDGSVPGIHLRWDLMGKLENHIPKGNNDTVKIYRSKYEQKRK